MATATSQIKREAVMSWRAIVLIFSLQSATSLMSGQIHTSALEQPQTFGTAAGYTTMMGYDLARGGYAYLDKRHGATFCSTGFGPEGEGYAHMLLPDGATLSELQLWAYDIDTNAGLTVSLEETCQAAGFNAPVTTQIGSADTFGAIGHYFGFTPLNGHRVNSRDCAYTVRVRFSPEGGLCNGAKRQIQKVHVSWFREVSPAPATATFDDVPTSHPLFQYVEALVKAGVTGGCGANNFCPGAPLTRGQMAVFLSRALGLQWP